MTISWLFILCNYAADKKNWAKSVNPAQNCGNFKIAPSHLSFINLTNFHNYKDFLKNSNLHIFLILEVIHSLFCTLTHNNDLTEWCDFNKILTSCKSRSGLQICIKCSCLCTSPHKPSQAQNSIILILCAWAASRACAWRVSCACVWQKCLQIVKWADLSCSL